MHISGWWWVLIAAGALVAAGVGVWLSIWRAQQIARKRRRAPKRWPVSVRAAANSDERKVWRWLTLAFPDHSVMLKMPVTRFTLPNSKEHGVYWYELLSSLYCTFTLVGADGQVIGCVDMPARTGGPSRTLRMKDTLMHQCGLHYVMLDMGNLPSLLEIRTVFFGAEGAAMPKSKHQTEAITAASDNLRRSLIRKRQTRSSDFSPLSTGSGGLHSSNFHDEGASQFSGSWNENSFIMPLDSRKGGLH